MKKIHIVLGGMLFITTVVLNACKTVRNLNNPPKPWSGECAFNPKVPEQDPAKKNVFIIADANVTEIFDMLAPFYLFNNTGKANVYIVTKDSKPILVKRNLFILPQLTFRQADSLKLEADVIVIPALSIRDENQDSSVIDWIKRHVANNTKLLAICDGAATAAATGLYDGRSITCHATDLQNLQPHFKKPVWINNTSVAKSGNLFSTAGVSNAVEGSLTVIDELFGSETMQKVLTGIYYPNAEIKLAHKSIVLTGRNKLTAAVKVLFRSNKNIGLLLQNGISEFDMAGLIDTYSRTLPASFKTYTLNDSIIQTRYGLTLVYTGDNAVKGLDELHVLMPGSFSTKDEFYFKNTKIIRYEKDQNQYLFDACLHRIAGQYGKRFANFIKISLDYN